MKNQLTDRQKEILTFIEQFLSENGYPPTLREIGKFFGISSTFGVKRHLEALEKKGHLEVESNSSRAITLLKSNLAVREQNTFAKVPIVGRVAAGSPILAIENIEGEVIVDPTFIKKADETFALRIKGDSMINAGIMEGDVVIVSPGKEVTNGDIVVAMLEGEATVKTFEKKNDQIRLIPENKNYQPIVIQNAEDFSLVGKVVGVVRWLN